MRKGNTLPVTILPLVILLVSGCDSAKQPLDVEPDPGSVRVTVSMIDSAPAFPFVVRVGENSRFVSVASEVTFAGIPHGAYEVAVDYLDRDCAVFGRNPVSVDVTPGRTTSVGFSITCSPFDAWERAAPGSSGSGESYYFFEHGRFGRHAGGTYHISGTYTRVDSVINMAFSGSGSATGTIHGDSLLVQYDLRMQLSDFEDGWFVRSSLAR